MSTFDFFLSFCTKGINYLIHVLSSYRGKGKVLPEGPEGEQMYTSTLPSTLALNGVGGQHHASSAVHPGKTRYSLYGRLGGSQGRSRRLRKISPPPEFDPRTAQPVSESLYRLNYPGFPSYKGKNK